MKILNEKPPAWIMDGCMSKFRVDVNHTFWTYGDAIYNPGGMHIPDFVIAHEEVHVKQQAEMGKDEWWKKYFIDPEFRLSQELAAYQVEYGFFCKHVKDRERRNKFLHSRASVLSGGLYQLAIPHSESMKKIRNGR